MVTPLPKWLYEVTLKLDCSYILSQEMSFSDYIHLMWEIKTMAFISFWKKVINKMHIVEIESTLSPHIVMSVWWFIHEQKVKASDLWKTREGLYNERCEWLAEKALSLNQNE